jgi:N-methylhydantoinase A
VEKFHEAHARSYGHSESRVPVEIVNLRLRVIGQLPRPPLQPVEGEAGAAPAPFDRRSVVLTNDLETIPFYRGQHLQPGHHLAGPAVVVQPDTTVFLERGDRLRVDRYLNFIVEVGRA